VSAKGSKGEKTHRRHWRDVGRPHADAICTQDTGPEYRDRGRISICMFKHSAFTGLKMQKARTVDRMSRMKNACGVMYCYRAPVKILATASISCEGCVVCALEKMCY